MGFAVACVGMGLVAGLGWGPSRRLLGAPGALHAAALPGARAVRPQLPDAANAPAGAVPPQDPTEVFAGTDVDGDVRSDAAGHLILDGEVRRLFDYFLLTLDAEPLEAIQRRLEGFVRRALPPMAATEAMALWRRYMGFRDALADLSMEGAPDLQQSLAQVMAVQARYFTAAEQDALFAADNRENAQAVAILNRLHETAPDADIQARLAPVLQSLPAPQAASRHASRAAVDYLAAADRLAPDDADAHAHLRASQGPRVAQRLAALDEQRRAWDERVQRFANEVAAATRNADPLQLGALRAAALEQQFTPAEAARVRALLQWHDGAPQYSQN